MSENCACSSCEAEYFNYLNPCGTNPHVPEGWKIVRLDKSLAVIDRLLNEEENELGSSPSHTVVFKKQNPGDNPATAYRSLHSILLDGKPVGRLSSRKDWVKKNETDRLRSKVATVWSISWDYRALKEIGVENPKTFSSRTYRPDSSDVLWLLNLQ